MMNDRVLRIILAVIAAIAALCFAQQKVNLKRVRRARQAAFPIVSLIYAIVAVGLAVYWAGKLEDLLLSLGLFQMLDGIPVASGFLGALENILNVKYTVIHIGVIAFNAVILVAFLVLKGILLPIANLIWKSKRITERTSDGFYEYDETYSEWFLRRKWANARALFLSFIICIGMFCAAFIIIIIIKGPSSPLWLFFFPTAVLVIAGEMFGFINGQTRAEFISSVLGEDSDSRRISQFYRVREIYEKMFPAQILTAHTGSEFTGKNSAVDLLKKLSEGDRDDRATASYFALRDEEFKPDLDSVMATSKLMHGKSVVFLNPFYHDIGRYIVLPMTKALIDGKKCLVIAGRNSTFGDIIEWLGEELAAFNNVSTLWRIRELDVNAPDCNIGVISSRHMYDMSILKANREFFSETDFTFVLEPSLIINIGQIGFNIIIDEIHKNVQPPVFCICDRNVDGLVDTMSHLLRTEITDVIAPPIPRCIYSGMAWDADGDYLRQQLFDKQTRYLGNGLELSAVAIKNQVPVTTWFSETKSPVRDINWIAGQFHATLCRYMNIPSQQSNLYDKIAFESNIWKAPSGSESFLIVEDEFCNMFNTLKAYLSRGIDQAFVNVLSENYLLRDYMRCNSRLFLTDPGAIPSFMPDYAKTLRNTVIRLILQMTVRPVSETEVLNELFLAGHKSDDAFASMTQLVRRFTRADDSIFTISAMTGDDSFLMTEIENCFSIAQSDFERDLAESLKSAYYIVEDEKSELNYIDAKLFGHVTQTILPGQFMTYDGKYYYAKIVAPEHGVVLRRASDLYDDRKYYRQIRKYALDDSTAELTAIRKVMDIEIAFLSGKLNVCTTGYLEMTDNNDLRTARLIDFAEDPNVREYNREYRNKTFMRLHLPDCNDKIRFTVCMLMMEIFRSIFPQSWHYLAVVATRPDDISGMLNYITYELEGDIDNGYIYIIEDSDVDLGLLDAVDKNLLQLMEIIADFIDWHFEKMRELPMADPLPVTVTMPRDIKRKGLFSRMASRIRRIFGGKEEEVKIRMPEQHTAEQAVPPQPVPAAPEADTSEAAATEAAVPETAPTAETAAQPADAGDYALDGIDAQPQDEGSPPDLLEDTDDSPDFSLDAQAESAQETAAPIPEAVEESARQPEPAKRKTGGYKEDLLQPDEDADADLVHIDGTDIFDEDGAPTDNEWLEGAFVEAGIVPLTKTRYQTECFLKYGFEDIDNRIRVEDVRSYLRLRGFTNNSLTKSRLRDALPKTQLDLEAINQCDFCGLPLTGVSYEKLTDGRVRCRDCSASAIVSLEEAREMFYKIRELMESFFNIQFNVPIGVKITDAHTVARGWGSVFRPSTQLAARVLGYASKRRGNYFLCMENGSPRLAYIDTMVHELTHIWQYVNWNDKEIVKMYGSGSNRDIVYEGMACWASVQYLYQLGETSYAELQELLLENRDDVYGVGFCLYREKYPFIKDFSMQKASPFIGMPPL